MSYNVNYYIDELKFGTKLIAVKSEYTDSENKTWFLGRYGMYYIEEISPLYVSVVNIKNSYSDYEYKKHIFKKEELSEYFIYAQENLKLNEEI